MNLHPVINAVEVRTNPNPNNFSLEQNYPNPFNPKTVISYKLAMNSDVELSIFNLLGQKVTTLVNKKQQAGSYQVEWDASGFTSGVYLYKLQIKDSPLAGVRFHQKKRHETGLPLCGTLSP